MIEREVYTVTEFEVIPTPSDVLQSGQLDEIVSQRLRMCIDTEAPITRELLLKRVINSFNVFKVGWRVNEYFKRMLVPLDGCLRDECGVPVYHSENENTAAFRPDTKAIRFSHQIPPSEAANAIVKVLEDKGRRVKRQELYSAFINILGYSKSGSDLSDLFKKALKYALDNQLVSKTSYGSFYV